MLLSKIKNVGRLLSAEKSTVKISQVANLQHFAPPPKRKGIEWPENVKLKIVPKVPQYPPSQRPFKMQKRLRYMRGPELYHTDLLHRQFGIQALIGGRMRYEHFEMIRMLFIRRLDYKKIFAVWRVDAPWQPVTKKGLGQQMGGGKGPIDHYVTPIRAGRIIVEVGGDVEYFEVQNIIENAAKRLPFKAKAVTYEMMQEDAKHEKYLEEENINPWTWKYMIQNNIGGCNNWISPVDKRWFNKHR